MHGHQVFLPLARQEGECTARGKYKQEGECSLPYRHAKKVSARTSKKVVILANIFALFN